MKLRNKYVMPSSTVTNLVVVYAVYCRVLVLENGDVREFDSPTTLLSNRNSQFYALAKNAGLV